jgi:hypothetical protein
MDERQFGRLGLDEHRGERGPEAAECGRHAGWSSLGGSGRPKHSGQKRSRSVSGSPGGMTSAKKRPHKAHTLLVVPIARSLLPSHAK